MSQPRSRNGESTKCYIALGANVTSSFGTPSSTITRCFERLDNPLLGLSRKSELYETPAFPKASDPPFVNAVAELETRLSAGQVLDHLHEIEAEFGRIRETRWAERTLDLDLLSYGSMVSPDCDTYNSWRDLPLEDQLIQIPDQLILPHPRLQERAFVLVPWAEIAPDWIHPVSGQSVAQMGRQLSESDKRDVKRI